MDSSQRKGMIPVSPSQTPRPSEKVGRELRSAEGNGNSSGKFDKDKGVNVQVILRCRPLSEDELRINTPVVISCNEPRREVSAVQNIANKQIDRTFVFDKVFGPTSKQKDLFHQAISPIVNEVLEGYNCTIFAYGQTGTGKTYTMEGGRKAKNGEFPSDAGVIPRAVRQIFDILESQCAEYSMKVTFLELYNEEITDLLAPDESKFSDDKSKKPIALMEDGKGGVFVRGLEEEIVYTASEIYKILDKGSTKRRTAETLLNKQSSRSHSIFSITIHIKECTPEGEEMIKCGKLNLVDLAGSENISRSGARDGRAREAGEINKSLLTLGRVINALVEHSGHIPYRDSKLTRLLRDSLGGKTKTCIIATISPSIHCLEETLSTLDYAHRAKNIKNKPEINQKMLKSAMIKDLYAELDRLKQEVFAAREKNGIYIPRDRFLAEEAEKKAMTEKIEHLELELDQKDKQLVGLQELYNSQQLLTTELNENLKKTQKKLEDSERALLDLEERYRQAKSKIKEKEFFISNLLKSEKLLVERAYELRSELDCAATDISGLFSKIERKDEIEDGNRIIVQKFRSQLTEQLEILHKTVSTSVTQQESQLKEVEEDMRQFVFTKAEATQEIRGRVERLKSMYASGIRALDDLSDELDKNSLSTFERLNSQVLMHSAALEDCFKVIASDADQLLHELQMNLSEQEDKLTEYAKEQRKGHHRAVEATRTISKITSNFFHTLDIHASNLTKIFKESQTVQDKQLCELEKKFEECSANEERQLLEKVAEMLASSSARKKSLSAIFQSACQHFLNQQKLKASAIPNTPYVYNHCYQVQAAVDSLRGSAADRTNYLQKEMSNAQSFTCSVKDQWNAYTEETEHHYLEDVAAIEKGKLELDKGFEICMTKAKLGSNQWRVAKDSLLNLDKENVASVDSIVRTGLETNQQLRSKLSLAASTTLQDVDIANKDLHSSIEHSLKLDHDACANINCMLEPCCVELRELRGGHYHKIVEITENTGKCLEEEYMVDVPSCSTPRRRPINLPSIKSIEELRTPSFEELLHSFWEAKSASKEANGDLRHFPEPHESQLQSLKDARFTLTAIN